MDSVVRLAEGGAMSTARPELPRPPPTVSEVREAVDAALPVVRANAEAAERSRRLPDAVTDALRATGINRLFVPTELGGLEASVLDLIEVTESIAAVDGSTAWCAVIGAGSNLFAGYLPRAGAAVVFADPDQPSATMFAPEGRLVPVDGGFRLSGRWPFTSNCLHSEWIGLGAAPADGNGSGPPPPVRVVFVRAADLEIEDTWRSTGLRATGSHHVVAHDILVAREHVSVFGRDPWADGRLWRIPVVTTYLPLLAAVALGLARGALDEVLRQVQAGRAARRGQLADDPAGLGDLATADARLRGARAWLREVVLEVQAVADRGEPISLALQAACLPRRPAGHRRRRRGDLHRPSAGRRRGGVQRQSAAARRQRRLRRSPAPAVRPSAPQRPGQGDRRPRRPPPAARGVPR